MNDDDWLRKRFRTRRQGGCLLVPLAAAGALGLLWALFG